MKRTLIYFSAAALFFFSGCEKFLDHEPDQRADLNSVEKMSELLATAYPKGDYITMAESMSDNAGDKGGGTVEAINQNPYFFNDVQSKDEGSPDYYWEACYAAISAANHALDAIGKVPNPNEYKALKGEALLARAYAHFMLVTFFSKVYNPATAASDPGIPYVTEPETVVIKKYERKTVQYVYDMIEKDLTEGLPLINNSIYKSPKFHFNTTAARAFAVRFYLFKRDYAKVLEQANLAFPGSSISANLRPWATSYASMTYYVLQAQYTRSTENANLLLVETPSVWGRNYASYRYGLTNTIQSATLSSNNPAGATLAYRVYGGTDLVLNIPKFYEHFVRANANAQIGDPYNMVPLLTTEEVLFNKAEAYVELGRYQEAVSLINTFLSTRVEDYDPGLDALTIAKAMAFYQTSDTKDALIKSILHFKRAEFMHEGMRWFDMLRHGIPVVHQSFDKSTSIVIGPEDPRRVVQIPQEAATSGIELNPR